MVAGDNNLPLLLEHTQEFHTDWSLTGDTANRIMSHHAFLHTEVEVEANLLVVYEYTQQRHEWGTLTVYFTHITKMNLSYLIKQYVNTIDIQVFVVHILKHV